MSLRHLGQAASILIIMVTCLIILQHYARPAPNAKDDTVIVISSRRLPLDTKNNHSSDIKKKIEDTSMSRLPNINSLSTPELKIANLLPSKYLFQPDGENPMIDCNAKGCLVHAIYRSGVTSHEISNFMYKIQSKEYEEIMKREGFYIQQMSFGENEKTKKEEIRLYLRDKNSYDQESISLPSANNIF